MISIKIIKHSKTIVIVGGLSMLMSLSACKNAPSRPMDFDVYEDLSYVEYTDKEECAALSEDSKRNTELTLQRVLPLPDNFKGNIVYDPSADRLFGITLGPPANAQHPSTLYEFDSLTADVIAKAELPFTGRISNPVITNGFLYQAVPHESRLYKIATTTKEFGQIIDSRPLPTLLDLELTKGDLIRFTFIAFSGMTLTNDENWLIQAEDLGQLITVDKHNGSVLNQISTPRSLRGITRVHSTEKPYLILANTDTSDARRKVEERRFMYRGIHGIFKLMPDCFKSGERVVQWSLIDPQTGKIIAETLPLVSRFKAESISFIRHEAVEESKFGRYVFMTTGPDGILIYAWTPNPLENNTI